MLTVQVLMYFNKRSSNRSDRSRLSKKKIASIQSKFKIKTARLCKCVGIFSRHGQRGREWCNSVHNFIFTFPCHLSVCLVFQQQKNPQRVHVCALSVALVQMLSGPASRQPLRLLNESACYIIRDGWMQILRSLRRKFLATCQFWLQSFRGDYIVQL